MRKKELVGGLTDELAPVGADLRSKHHTERSHEQNEGQGPDDLTHGIPFLAGEEYAERQESVGNEHYTSNDGGLRGPLRYRWRRSDGICVY